MALLLALHVAKAINVSTSGTQSAEILEFSNGCLCCSMKDTGVAAIENLMDRKGAFDYILLETTGMADPGPFPPDQPFSWSLTAWMLRSHCVYLLAE
jgi:G3E family GTPase